MNIDNLKPGTKLIWDSITASNDDGSDDNAFGVIYTVTVGKKNKNGLLRWIQVAENLAHWMCGEQRYLRIPTAEELKSLQYPILTK